MDNQDLGGSAQRVPISVLTGFLGSGKTTVLNHLIRQPALERTLVLINEFGEIGIDHHLVAHSTDDVVVEMASGCLCCTIRGDLAKTLRDAPGRFARGGKRWFDRVVIETTGLADPAPILHTLMTEPSVSRQYRLDGVVTTVDAVNGGETLERHIESAKQAAMADRLLLTKTDLVDEKALRDLRGRLQAMNPGAPQIVARDGVVDVASLFDAGLYDPTMKSPDVQAWLKAEAYGPPHTHDHHAHHRHDHGAHNHAAHDHGAHDHGGHGDHDHHHHDHHHDVNRHDAHIKAVCLSIEEPILGEALDLWLETLLAMRGADVLRIKALVNIVGLSTPVVIHGVQHILHPPLILKAWPSEDRRSRIVFITRDIDEAVLRETLKPFNVVPA